jgi:hypothetical protein
MPSVVGDASSATVPVSVQAYTLRTPRLDTKKSSQQHTRWGALWTVRQRAPNRRAGRASMKETPARTSIQHDSKRAALLCAMLHEQWKHTASHIHRLQQRKDAVAAQTRQHTLAANLAAQRNAPQAH